MTGTTPTAIDNAEDDRLQDIESIGEGIRRERLRRGLTLAQLASQVNLTVSALSQIERGASDPSISSLRRIAQAFGIPMFQFLVGTDRRDIVVRRNRRTKINFPDRDIDYELVSADTIGEFEVLGLTLSAGGATGADRDRATERGMLDRPARPRARRGRRSDLRARCRRQHQDPPRAAAPVREPELGRGRADHHHQPADVLTALTLPVAWRRSPPSSAGRGPRPTRRRSSSTSTASGRNIAEMAALAARRGVALRPHFKTHKSVAIARRQIAAGAVGMTVAKLDEAEALIDGGVDDILVAYEIVGRAEARPRDRPRASGAADPRRRQCRRRARDRRAAAVPGLRVPVLIEVDSRSTAASRCGVPPADAPALARAIAGPPGARARRRVHARRPCVRCPDRAAGRGDRRRRGGRGPRCRRGDSRRRDRGADGQRRVDAHRCAGRARTRRHRDPAGHLRLLRRDAGRARHDVRTTARADRRARR